MADMKKRADEFITRKNKAKEQRNLWDSMLEEAYDLFLPTRQTEVYQSNGEERNTQLYDSTGVEALQEFVDNLKQMLLPSYQRWAEARPSGEAEAEVELGIAERDQFDELSRQLDLIVQVVFRYIWISNFDQASHESLQDSAISTGAMQLIDNDDVKNPLKFISVPSNQLILENDGAGGVGGVFREHKVKVQSIPQLWPKAKRDSAIESMIREKPMTEVEVVEGTIYNAKKKIWNYTVYIKTCERKIYFEDKYKVSPWIIFRLSVAPGEVMGRGPALQALPAMRVLNKLEAQLIYNNDMAVMPPVMMDVNQSLLDVTNVSLSPQSILPVNYGFDGQMSAFRYLETKANFNIGLNMKEERQRQIKGMFALAQLGDVAGPTKSATEMTIRNNQALSRQAAMFGRLQQEFVVAVIHRAHYILSQYDIVPKELRMDNELVDIRATSPLARVQDMADLEGLMNYINTASSFGDMGPAMISATLKTQDIGPYLADKMGVPASLKLDEKGRKEAQAQLERVMATAAQGQEAQQ